MQKTAKVLIAAGGTGGHLIPAQQLAERLRSRSGYEVLFAGYKLDRSPYFGQRQFPFFDISSASITEGKWKVIKGVTRGFFQAVRMLRKVQPDVVVGFGSYHSAPVLLASVALGKKIVLYEANRTIGKVNRWLSFAAIAIGYQFPLIGWQSPKLVPIRWLPWRIEQKRVWTQQQALAEYGLNEGRFTLLVFGGSQGASFLNETAPSVVQQLSNAQVIHLAGSELAAQKTRDLYQQKKIPACVLSFEQEMEKAYAAADFALCRSGAGTTAELIRYAVPALLIPYPYAAESHQQENAKYVCSLGGAMQLAQSEADIASMVDRIEKADREKMQTTLRQAARENEELEMLDELVSRVCNRKK